MLLVADRVLHPLRGLRDDELDHRRHGEEAERGQALGEAEPQQQRQHQFAGGGDEGGELGRQKRHRVDLLEEKGLAVPALDTAETGLEENPTEVTARGEFDEWPQATVEQSADAGIEGAGLEHEAAARR